MSDEIETFVGNLNDLKERISKESHLVVLDFFATWCGPCSRLSRNLPSIANENKDVTFIKIEVDKNQELVQHFNVIAIPYLFFIKKDTNEDGYTMIDEGMGTDINFVKECIAKYKF